MGERQSRLALKGKVTMTKIIFTMFGIGLAATAFACGSAPADTQAAPASADPESAAIVDRTVVHFNPDGTQTVHKLYITKAEQKADMERRRAFQAAAKIPPLVTRALQSTPKSGPRFTEDITQDTSWPCAGSDIWIFAQSTNCTTDSNSEICFYNSGTAYMDAYTWCPATPPTRCEPSALKSWVDSVKSYDPLDSEDGYFSGVNGDFNGDEDFSSTQGCTSAGTWASHDVALVLTD